jgi:hypothetical protein
LARLLEHFELGVDLVNAKLVQGRVFGFLHRAAGGDYPFH